MPNRSEWNEVGHEQSNRRLDLHGGGFEHRPIDCRGRNRAMNDMINFVTPESKDLSESTADLIEANHRSQDISARSRNLLGRRDHDRIEIIVTEFTLRMAERRVVSEIGAIGIEFAN